MLVPCYFRHCFTLDMDYLEGTVNKRPDEYVTKTCARGVISSSGAHGALASSDPEKARKALQVQSYELPRTNVSILAGSLCIGGCGWKSNVYVPRDEGNRSTHLYRKAPDKI